MTCKNLSCNFLSSSFHTFALTLSVLGNELSNMSIYSIVVSNVKRHLLCNSLQLFSQYLTGCTAWSLLLVLVLSL